jgi:hypothetical protein
MASKGAESPHIKDTATSIERKSMRSQQIGLQERPASAQAARASLDCLRKTDDVSAIGSQRFHCFESDVAVTSGHDHALSIQINTRQHLVGCWAGYIGIDSRHGISLGVELDGVIMEFGLMAVRAGIGRPYQHASRQRESPASAKSSLKYFQ